MSRYFQSRLLQICCKWERVKDVILLSWKQCLVYNCLNKVFISSKLTTLTLSYYFFEDVLVMADDPSVRAARLSLVGRVARLPEHVADLSAMEGF